MSLRRFGGWEPRTVTTYEYDEDGRLLQSVTVTESEWDDEARAYAIALTDLEADTCKGCGQPLSESTHPDAFQGYTVDEPAVCQGCKALDRQHRKYAAAKDRDLHLNRYRVRRTWTPPDQG